MAKAVWNGAVVALSDSVQTLEGNRYFPPDSVDRRFLAPSKTRTHCAWKGQAHYYDVVVSGQRNPDAAWFYPEPSAKARQIKDHVAFWKGVEVTE